MLHLFHPALVHFSIALIVLGGVSELWGMATRRESSAGWGGQLLLLGLVSLLPTIVSGYLAANTVTLPPGGVELVALHERVGLVLLVVLLTAQFWKAWFRGRLPAMHARLYAGLVGASLLLAGYAAWLGGRMVYGLGIGVR